MIVTGPPKVTLRAARPRAYDGAIAAAMAPLVDARLKGLKRVE